MEKLRSLQQALSCLLEYLYSRLVLNFCSLGSRLVNECLERMQQEMFHTRGLISRLKLLMTTFDKLDTTTTPHCFSWFVEQCGFKRTARAVLFLFVLCFLKRKALGLFLSSRNTFSHARRRDWLEYRNYFQPKFATSSDKWNKALQLKLLKQFSRELLLKFGARLITIVYRCGRAVLNEEIICVFKFGP